MGISFLIKNESHYKWWAEHCLRLEPGKEKTGGTNSSCVTPIQDVITFSHCAAIEKVTQVKEHRPFNLSSYRFN